MSAWYGSTFYGYIDTKLRRVEPKKGRGGEVGRREVEEVVGV